MESVVLLAILALLIFGLHRGGRMPGPVQLRIGVLILVWLAVAFGLGSLWNAIVGPVAQP